MPIPLIGGFFGKVVLGEIIDKVVVPHPTNPQAPPVTVPVRAPPPGKGLRTFAVAVGYAALTGILAYFQTIDWSEYGLGWALIGPVLMAGMRYITEKSGTPE